MALSNAERQKRFRARRDVQAQTNPNTLERALLQEVERCERGELSDQERIGLADRLADLAMDFQRRAIRISKMAVRVRTGENHPLQR